MTTRAPRATRRGGSKAASSSAAAAAAPAAAFSDLPDELALRIFSCLDLHTRVGVAALVCTRWRQLTHSPPLLCSIQARIRGSPARTLLQSATSFCTWFFSQAAPHAERLHVELPYDHGAYKTWGDDAPAVIDELTATLRRATAQRGCRLQDLRLAHGFDEHDWDLPADCWGLSSLRRLSIHMPESCLGFFCRPDSLPLLTDLELLAYMELHEDEPRPLPLSLTHLRMTLQAEYWEGGPPDEIQELPNLRSLVLHRCSWEATGYDELLAPCFPGLQRLALVRCLEVPLCLGSMTALELLQLSTSPEHAHQEDADQLARVLRCMSRLTGLIINHSERLWQRANLAGAIAHLPLQHLSMLGADPSHDEPPLALPPPGRWQAQLRQLALPAATAAAALPQLASATQLESLTLLHLCSMAVEQQEAVLAFAAQHPSLRCLRLDASGPHLSAATFAAVSSTLRANRALRLLPGLSSRDAGRLAEEAWEACCGSGCGGE